MLEQLQRLYNTLNRVRIAEGHDNAKRWVLCLDSLQQLINLLENPPKAQPGDIVAAEYVEQKEEGADG